MWACGQEISDREGATQTEQAIEYWCQEASAASAANRRQNRRLPFFRPVTVTLGDSQATKLAAFTRDISITGTGLFHNMPLETRRVSLTIPTIGGRHFDVVMKVKWCKPCGQGWYLSGARFIDPSAYQALSLLMATVATEVERRWRQRYPFFQPITVTSGGPQATKLAAFTRDISLGSIGLLHHMPVETQHVTLTIPTIAGPQVDVSAKVIWCKPCGQGWYLSGGRFTRRCFEQLPAFRP